LTAGLNFRVHIEDLWFIEQLPFFGRYFFKFFRPLFFQIFSNVIFQIFFGRFFQIFFDRYFLNQNFHTKFVFVSGYDSSSLLLNGIDNI